MGEILMQQLELRLEVLERILDGECEDNTKLENDLKMMGADVLRMQKNMEHLFEYLENLETRIKVLEEEMNRWDFGYDPVETLAKRLQEKYDESGAKLWKDKFAMDKPDGVQK
tara:strand:+ start:1509 stop:1847 length:339 start_codon:yes stop_codon:yes gene_type:complete